jgi:hypothetical protein
MKAFPLSSYAVDKKYPIKIAVLPVLQNDTLLFLLLYRAFFNSVRVLLPTNALFIIHIKY